MTSALWWVRLLILALLLGWLLALCIQNLRQP